MANALEIVIKAKDEASAALEGLRGKMEDMAPGFKKAGIAMTAAGGAITGMLGMATKAALDEQIGINQLSIALKNAGISYDAEKEAIEGTIAALQKKTSYGDGPQREALSQLIALTGDYETSLQALPVVMDMASALGMDLTSTSQLLAKAFEGNTGALSRYGIQLDEGATKTDILAKLTSQFGGSAEAMADPLAQLKNSLGDLAEDVGKNLLPLLKDLVEKIMGVLGGVMDWMKANPELARLLTIVALAIGGIMVVVGPLLIALPLLAAGIGMVGTAITVATGPIGLIALAITALIAIGILVWKNWDTISEKAKEIWGRIVAFFLGVGDAISALFKRVVNIGIGIVETYVNIWIKGINFITGALSKIQVSIPDWVPGIGGKSFGINIPAIPEIALPRLAEGGIVTRPTLVLAGEKGDEAIVPLKRMPFSVEVKIENYGVIGIDDLDKVIHRSIRDGVRRGAFEGVL